MTYVHILPAGEPPEAHRLGNCPCRPRTRPRHRPDGSVIDHVHIHRAAADLLDGPLP